MKKLCQFIVLVTAILAAGPAAAQYSGQARTAAATRSVLKQPDQVEWADYHVGTVAGPGISGCPDAHVTCSTGVCYGYDNCCCRPHLLCCLKKIGRMLDCLLPCHKCCPNECAFGACRPHLFDCGHCGGCGLFGCGHRGGCGHCGGGCGPSCSSPIGYPGVTDPFIDDPIPPRPMPEPARDVRHRPTPAPTPYAVRKVSPYKVTTTGEVARQSVIEASRHDSSPVAAPVTTPYNPRDKFAAQPRTFNQPAHSRAAPKSILQSAVAEEEVTAELRGNDDAPMPPALLPVTIRRTSAELPEVEVEIPINPLRK